MEVFVETNLLKLLTPAFIHVSSINDGVFEVNKNYYLHIPKHGCIGTVQCLMAQSKMLYDLHGMYVTMSEGVIGYKERMQLRGHKQMDVFQINMFRFKKRKTNAFQTLYDEQRLIAELNIIPQTSLFK